jgi:hypothetical protein
MRIAPIAALAALTFALPADAQRGREQRQENAFVWSGDLADGARLIARNLNGSIRVEAGAGRTLEIVAHKEWRRGEPTRVTIEATRINNGRDVLLCARWTPETVCTEQQYSTRGNGSRETNDVQVDYVIRLPAGAQLTATTVNGGLRLSDLRGDLRATTVNGNVEASVTSAARVHVETVNGSLRVALAAVPAQGLEAKTVNGSISLGLPANAPATIDGRTVNGTITTEMPVAVEGTMSPRRLRGTLAGGGPRLELSTVNGSIRLHPPR